MEAPSTIPPMAIMKTEERPVRSERSATPSSFNPTTFNKATSRALNANESTAILVQLSLSTSEIEVPSRFRPIVEKARRRQPELLKAHYNGFLRAETMATIPSHNAEQIKLYPTFTAIGLTILGREFMCRHGPKSLSMKSNDWNRHHHRHHSGMRLMSM